MASLPSQAMALQVDDDVVSEVGMLSAQGQSTALEMVDGVGDGMVIVDGHGLLQVLSVLDDGVGWVVKMAVHCRVLGLRVVGDHACRVGK